MRQLVLGSNSPRRSQMLADMGFQFIVRAQSIDETIPDQIDLKQAAQYLAEQKNQILEHKEDEVILTADTIVLFQNESLAKADNVDDASEMIRKMSGQIHDVITGVCIRGEKAISFSNHTEVKFKRLSNNEINYYVSKQRPFDKAGAYGIQDWIGLIGIEWIKGSFYNVVGLPTDEVYYHLTSNFNIWPNKYS